MSDAVIIDSLQSDLLTPKFKKIKNKNIHSFTPASSQLKRQSCSIVMWLYAVLLSLCLFRLCYCFNGAANRQCHTRWWLILRQVQRFAVLPSLSFLFPPHRPRQNHLKLLKRFRVQELCESRGGRPAGLPGRRPSQ